MAGPCGVSQILLRSLLKHDYSKPLKSATRIASSRKYSTERNGVSIPNRIHRSPTDILEALSQTVKRDPTAPDYRFMDDPFLIPTSGLSKRAYALAREAGKKAARWIRDEHANLFQHRVADPFIKAFAPMEKLTEQTPATEELLKQMIHSVQVTDAIQVYNLLQNNQTDVSPETKQALLELVCFYNEEDQLDEDWLEERGFITSLKNKEQGNRVRKTWKDSGFAEKLFQSMESKTANAYCALICGMAMHGQAEGAWIHYNQMRDQGFVPNLDTYNQILRMVGFSREGADVKWRLVEDTLKEMVSTNTKPNIQTMNAILETITTVPIPRVAKDLVLNTLAEFQSIGIKPSLTSYFHILNIYYRNTKGGGTSSTILEDIVSRLENEFPSIQEAKDVLFFPRAMEVCNSYLEDVNLAKRLHQIYTGPTGRILAGDFHRDAAFYRNFIQLLGRMETPDEFMEYYHLLVPNVYSPEQGVFEGIVRTLRDYSAIRYVPQLWNDAVLMELSTRERTVEVIIEALASGSPPSPTILKDQEVDPVLTTARSIWSYVEGLVAPAEEEKRPSHFQWTGTMLGNLMKVHLLYGDFPGAVQVMDRINGLRSRMVSFVSAEALNLLLDQSVRHKRKEPALMAVDYAADVGYSEAAAMAKTAAAHFDLSPNEKAKLSALLAVADVQ